MTSVAGLVASGADQASLSGVLSPLDCIVGLGANLGECERTFGWAVEQIQGLGEVTALSNLYENPAVGGPPQPDYLNAAVRLTTTLDPHALLLGLQQIEKLAGRERTIKWGPRTLDLDLLWIAGVRIDTPSLTVPHPRLLERAFALKPLTEVAPKARSPISGLTYANHLETLDVGCLKWLAAASGPPWKWSRQRSRTLIAASVAYP